MRIAYVTHTRFPTEKAHGYQVAQVCDALVSLGNQVTLVAPTVRRNAAKGDPFRFYGMQPSFSFEYLTNFDALTSPFIPGKIAFSVSIWSYRRRLRQFLASHSFDLLYARSPVVLQPLIDSGRPVILELHALPRRDRRHFKALCNRCQRVVALTYPMRDALVALGVESALVVVEGDAVDPERFRKTLSSPGAKRHWNLPQEIPVVGYVGSLATYDRIQKGVDVLIHALASLKKSGFPVFGWIVGGPKHWEDHYRRLAYSHGLTEGDIRFQGQVRAREIPDALAACDVCAYPAPHSKHAFFQRDTSPLKLFEYLAASRPVVCADIPPVRDIVDDRSVRFFHPGDHRSMAGAIRQVLEHPREATARKRAGLSVVEGHAWKERMRRIFKGIRITNT